MYFCRPHLQFWRRLPERQLRKKQVLLSDLGGRLLRIAGLTGKGVKNLIYYLNYPDI